MQLTSLSSSSKAMRRAVRHTQALTAEQGQYFNYVRNGKMSRAYVVAKGFHNDSKVSKKAILNALINSTAEKGLNKESLKFFLTLMRNPAFK